jgi:putative membrane protein
MELLRLAGIGCVALAIVFSSCDKDDDDEAEPNNLSASDSLFMMKASRANRAEIELGAMAADKGNHMAVKDFGRHMVTDHTMSLNELDSLADRWNVNLPNDLDSLHKAKKQMLSGMSGYQFDTAYLNSQVKDHIDAIALYEQEAGMGQEQKLKDYAMKTLPHLRMHKAKVDSVLTVVH